MRAVLLAVYLIQLGVSGPMLARMSLAQSTQAGETIVICTPNGLKTIPWPDAPGERPQKPANCYCPCAALCKSCARPAGSGDAGSELGYDARRVQKISWPHLVGSAFFRMDSYAGSPRSPPALSIS